MDAAADGILRFWLDEVGQNGWYEPPEGLDDAIRDRYAGLWQQGRSGALDTWMCGPRGCLALLILLDQFPRNMFRGTAQAFASDAKARTVAKQAVRRGLDKRVALPERQFVYMPLEHSEFVPDQSQSVSLFLLAWGQSPLLLHARVHREVIRRFGRFPFRNAALGRHSSPQEQAFVDGGGYRTLVEHMRVQA